MKVRAASEGEGVFFCEFAELSALILVIGRVETLETAETMVSEHGDEFLRAGPAELILERMGENRETAGAEKCRENFLRGDKFPGAVIMGGPGFKYFFKKPGQRKLHIRSLRALSQNEHG